MVFVPPIILPIQDLPIIGPWIAKIGRIQDLWANPCSPTPEMWAKAAFTAIPNALFSPITPSEVDMAIIRVGFGGGSGGAFHGATKKFRFDVWDAIEGVGEIANKPSWVRFGLGEVLAAGLWYMVIVDATLDGLINWESLAYQYAGCKVPGSPWASCQTGGPGVWIPGLGGPKFTNFALNHGNIFTASSAGINTPIGYTPTVSYSFSYDPSASPPGLEPTGTVQLVDTSTGDVLDEGVMTQQADGTMNAQNVVLGTLQGTQAHGYALYWTGGGFIYFNEARIDANSQKLNEMFYPLIKGGHPKYGR